MFQRHTSFKSIKQSTSFDYFGLYYYLVDNVIDQKLENMLDFPNHRSTQDPYLQMIEAFHTFTDGYS